MKVPVRKKGSGEEFDQYRGVTLLSVVGKVFGMVVEARLREFCESRGILTDSQFGFRAGRACRDALLVLTEVVERRGKERVFAGFLDIAKAYPSVWRRGMWFKLWKVGVRGRMWRVLQTLYARCEVAVRVGGVADDWYEEFVGLREGCVVSPLLFAIYINDLPALLEEGGGGGVRVGAVVVRCLMFADDVVMVASTAAGLQRSLDLAGEYSRKWRFHFNFGQDKTAVMVFGGVREGEKWVLAGREVVIVDNYRYLGVRMVAGRRAKWSRLRDELLVKARGAFWRAWGLGMAGGFLSPKGAKGLYETLVRSVLEYAAEIDSGRWPAAEALQRWAGRMCLGVGRSVANEVVQGDLGWWTVQGMRDYLRLVYWGRLARGETSEVTAEVYRSGRERVRAGRAGAGEWCVGTARLLREVGMGEEWEKGKVWGLDHDGWKTMVRGLVRGREEDAWRQRMAGKSSLEGYTRVKRELKAEWFLGDPKCWVRRWVALRGGSACLAVVRGRWRRVPRHQRVCEWCGLGLVEDERHFVDVCERWVVERRGLWESIAKVDRRAVGFVAGWSSHARMDWLLAGGSARTRGVVVRKVGSWLAKREKLGGGKEGSRGWGEKPSVKGQRKEGVRVRGPGLEEMVRVNREAERERKEAQAAAKKAAGEVQAASLRAERNKSRAAAAKRSQRQVQREQPRAQALQAERQRRAGVRHAALFTERQREWASEAAAIAARAAARL